MIEAQSLIEQWGSHAPYILMGYGAAVLAFAFLIIEPILRRRQLRQQLQTQWRREQLAKSSAENAS